MQQHRGWICIALTFILSNELVKSYKDETIKTIFPQRLDSHRHKRDLSTATKEGHEDTASFAVTSYNGKNWKIDVKRNYELISPSFTLRYFKPDGTEVLKKDTPDHCHYQGSIRGQPESTVVLNTCNGLRGIIDTEDETYHIEPSFEDLQDNGAHKLYPARVSFTKNDCGNSASHSSSVDDAYFHGKHDQGAKRTLSRIRRSLIAANIDSFYNSYLATKETRYNELLVVVDQGMYNKYNKDTKTITDMIITLVNAVDAIYQRINIRIVMSSLEIWSAGDKIQRNRTFGGVDLERFREYRNKELLTKYPHDNAHLMSHFYWSDCAGMAYVYAMCGSNSVGVNAWDANSLIGPYVTLAHEMGHNFGFSHDTGYCKCLTPRGCIMGGHKTRVPGFSNCSMESLKKVDDTCFYNVPTQAINARCGNGIREGDEQCDCGTPENCAAKDPCCKPHDCKLKVSSQCSDLHHTCCQNCKFKKQGSLCRAVANECDVAEYCTGLSGDCPGNSYFQDGRPCSQAKKVILGNTDYYSVVKRLLAPRIEARYIRISPQYWKNTPCMRTELYGCSSGRVSATSPTPIKAYNNFCVTPHTNSCSPPDGNKPVFKSGFECKGNYMEFSLDANSILRHHCSNKKICPENGGTGSGTKLVISSTCTDERAKFIRTAGKALKHVYSGKCVHPNGGWPGDNVEFVLWDGCDGERLQFWFMKPDCVVPLGMQSKAITNKQITASSYRGSDYPYNARLESGTYWCAKNKQQSEYLQIDLGQVQTVSSIATQGRGTWYDWVTGYYIYYSQDGQQWTGYSESGNSENSNSYCYHGKCQDTREKQCKDLWGATAGDASQGCYDSLNIQANGYGTCDPATNSSCAAADVTCGQIQCQDSIDKPAVVDYGWTYKKITLQSGKHCSAATLKRIDSMGQGMIKAGTKCGDQKMCKDYKCQSFTNLGIKSCAKVNGLECAGRGVCTNNNVCQCDSGYDPATACNNVLQQVNGGFSSWSTWSKCSAGCNGGKQSRHRFCNNPTPLHGGQDCSGEDLQEQDCNVESCPIISSCRHLQMLGQENAKQYPDGIYEIRPVAGSSISIKTYCDMSRDGGGWTLLVASHTNSWTATNVLLRNENSPNLYKDYSILKYGNNIKDNLNAIGISFEYRLEAQSRGRWGGIWRAQRSYSLTATNDGQTNVKLTKKFDNWQIGDNSIENRIPWLNAEQLTTSKKGTSAWGTITDDEIKYHPAPWISGNQMESQPAYIWYWMREGPVQIPSSCSELQIRGYATTPLNNGIYTIKPPGGSTVKTYCDFTSDGGGWTLIATSKTHNGWNSNNVKDRNSNQPSLDSDYSILKWADAIKNNDLSQDFFQYRLEADGSNQYGGIFDAPKSYSFVSTKDQQTGVKLVKNFNNIDFGSNIASRMPRLGLSSDIFLSSASTTNDASGSIIYNGASQVYIPNSKPTPGVVRYWMREGTRRSCNDIKLHGVRAGKAYQDGYYMIRVINAYQYLPVFCDMTSEPGAFTLIVTSRHNNWNRAQVPARNIFMPSLDKDYSILKYADLIKNLGNNATFEYKLDANRRGHWGGVWKAPHKYSFMSENNKQTSVVLKTKFDNWVYSWWDSLNQRMPWYNAKETSTKALLTTSVDVDYYPSGSVIWGHTDRHPADWIWAGGMRDPGVIWYWVNEDDCDNNRQPINGGLSEWSAWSDCDKLCVQGKQRRSKTCTNPKPRCGGNGCIGTTTEEKNCYICPESPIKSNNGLCVQPNTATCSPSEGDYLVFKSGDSKCSQEYMKFLFDRNGIIHHKCSGKVICPEGGVPTYGRKLVLKNSCDSSVSKHQRLSSKLLKNLNNGFCVHPNGGWPNDGTYLVYWNGCDSLERLQLDFFKLPQP